MTEEQENLVIENTELIDDISEKINNMEKKLS